MADNFTLSSADIRTLRQQSDQINSNLKATSLNFKGNDYPIIAGVGGISQGLMVWAESKNITMKAGTTSVSFDLNGYNGTGIVTASIVSKNKISQYGLVTSISQVSSSKSITVSISAQGTKPVNKTGKTINFDVHVIAISVG
jgi:hypothetical protein